MHRCFWFEHTDIKVTLWNDVICRFKGKNLFSTVVYNVINIVINDVDNEHAIKTQNWFYNYFKTFGSTNDTNEIDLNIDSVGHATRNRSIARKL